MTLAADTFPAFRPAPKTRRPLPGFEVVGPYSPWPRQPQKTARPRTLWSATAAATVAAGAVLVHCVQPMLG